MIPIRRPIPPCISIPTYFNAVFPLPFLRPTFFVYDSEFSSLYDSSVAAPRCFQTAQQLSSQSIFVFDG